MKKGLFIFFIFLSTVFSQKNELKNLKVLSYTNKSELVKYMKVVSKELGVKCNFCHVTSDYSNDKKGMKKVAPKGCQKPPKGSKSQVASQPNRSSTRSHT